MNYPLDTIADTLAFAVRGEYDKRVYPANLGNGGGGIIRRPRCAWCINLVDGCAKTLAGHYYHECWSNFLPMGASFTMATAVVTIWER